MIREIDGDAEERAADFVKAKRGQAAIGYTDDFRSGRRVHDVNGEIMGGGMSGVRVLVGTRKGAFVLTADGARREWEVRGPFFPGWEVYHLDASPADPDRIWAAPSSGWFGQQIHRSDDGGRSWQPMGSEFAYTGVPGTHQWYDGTPHPWEFARVWHLEPSPTTRTPCWPGSRTPRCSARSTAAAPGRSCPGCASTAPARTGSPAPGACACTRSCPTRAPPTGCW